MRITKSSRGYSIIAGSAATTISVFLYVTSKSKLTLHRDVGESTSDQIRSAVTGTRLWLEIACVMALLTTLVSFVSRFMS
jgi:hypothetical protein